MRVNVNPPPPPWVGGVGEEHIEIQKGVSKPLVFMQKQEPMTENSQKGKKSWVPSPCELPECTCASRPFSLYNYSKAFTRPARGIFSPHFFPLRPPPPSRGRNGSELRW